jgi:hypothetical protein
MKKTEGRKSRATVPLKINICFFLRIFFLRTTWIRIRIHWKSRIRIPIQSMRIRNPDRFLLILLLLFNNNLWLCWMLQDWMTACTEEAVSFFCALQQSGQVEKLYQPDSSQPDLVYSAAPQPTSSYSSCQVSQSSPVMINIADPDYSSRLRGLTVTFFFDLRGSQLFRIRNLTYKFCCLLPVYF